MPLLIQGGYIVMAEIFYRFAMWRFKNKHAVTQIFIVLTYSIPCIVCTLANTNLLPDSLMGPGVNQSREYFRSTFLLLFPFHFVKMKNVLLFITPMYLVSSYFYLNQILKSQTVWYEELPIEMKNNPDLPVTKFSTSIAMSIFTIVLYIFSTYIN